MAPSAPQRHLAGAGEPRRVIRHPHDDALGPHARIIRAVREVGPRAGLTGIAEALGVSVPRVHQLVKSAKSEGALTTEPGWTARGNRGVRVYVAGEEPPEAYGDWHRTDRHESVLRVVRDIGRSRPSLAEIAERAGVTPSRVHQILEDLETAGEIERHGRPWQPRRPITVVDD